MHTNRSVFQLASRALAVTFLATGIGAAAFAQQPSSTPAPLFVASAESPANLTTAPDAALSGTSSSSSRLGAEDASTRFSLDATQPPPRRRYGRPNYADNRTNPDGSSKFAFMAGGGFTMPVQDTGKYLKPSYVFQVGAGRNWSKMFGILAQFDYNNFGFQGNTLTNQSLLYFGATGQGLDGSSHVWSFTLDPTITLHAGDSYGMYAVAGVGFYHKTANFTVPSTGQYCDIYYGCYTYQAQQSIDKYTSNAPGFNGGLGITYKPSRFAGERFYAEARYVYVDNYSRNYSVKNNNFYPPNANQTYYFPVTFGIRF